MSSVVDEARQMFFFFFKYPGVCGDDGLVAVRQDAVPSFLWKPCHAFVYSYIPSILLDPEFILDLRLHDIGILPLGN